MSGTSKPRSGGQILVNSLRVHGADLAFCVAGESYLDVLDAFHDASDIKLITCRHEGGAANMAEAAGKLTGRPGICFVTRGPGACNASIGVHTAMQEFDADDPVRGAGGPRSGGARGLPGNRLPPHVLSGRQMGGPDRRCGAHPGIHQPRLPCGDIRAARPRRSGAAGRHAARPCQRPADRPLYGGPGPSRHGGPQAHAPNCCPCPTGP